MLLYSFCTLIAALWLSYRLYKILTIPILKIVSNLNITTPPAIKASIDKISSNSITVHWENEPSDIKISHISHFLLYLNNIQLAIFPNDPNSAYTCCLISGLNPQEQYQLDFVTINDTGFINKLPSIYCMTKSTTNEKNLEDSNDSLDQIIDLDNPQQPNEELISSPNTSKTRKWRRNTVSSVNQPDVILNYVTSSNIPSYTNLTKLQDLEGYSIDDLKKILICAQEDLHEVLVQQTTSIQDFQDTKLNLEMELDNLKTHWSHEIEFKKSIKSNIKSLENAKLLSDLKFEKTNQKIEAIDTKIKKMNQDIANWETNEYDNLDRDKINDRYNTLFEENDAEILDLSKKIKHLQQDIANQELANKKLNTLKRSSSSTIIMEQSTEQSPGNTGESQQQVSTILKKINDSTSEKTGLLNNGCENYLSKLNQNSPIVKLVKEQVRIDQEFEQKWKTKKVKLIKRIKSLENKFNDASMNNKQLKTELFAQPYQQPGDSPSKIIPIMSTSSYNSSSINPTFSNPDSQTMPSVEAGNFNQQNINMNSDRIINPLLSAFNISVSNETSVSNVPIDHKIADDFNMLATSPNMNQSSFLNPLSINSSNSIDNSESIQGMSTFSRGVPTTAMTETIAAPTFPWSVANQQTPTQQNVPSSKIDYDNGFEYDYANHLITGLENMIYDENENSDKISNYSRAYTNDQLDSYWTTQKDYSNGSILPQRHVNINSTNTSNNAIFHNDFSPSNPPALSYTNDLNVPLSSSPLPGHTQEIISHTPNTSINLIQPQSLLAATLNDPNTLSPLNDNLSMFKSESASRNTMNGNISGTDALFSSNQPLSPSSSQYMAGAIQGSQLLGYNQSKHALSPQILNRTINSELLSSATTTPQQVDKDDTFTAITSSQPNDDKRETLFHSPSFNFIWHTTESPSKNFRKKSNNGIPNLIASPTKSDGNEHVYSHSPKSKISDSGQTHKRNKSSGSVSSWGNRLSLKSRQSIASTVIEDMDSVDETNQDSNNKDTNSTPSKKTGSSSRKISRLLSRSGMNNLFKLPSHDTQQST